ncbi:MAG: class I SAM-dependent methyltransferase [Alphaproteobacteria bacterium]|nr:class I SAM-dependent methyltransferase [Alphaproteobacteria bacterium]
MDLYTVTFVLLIIFIVIWASYEYYERQTGVPTFPSMPAARRKIIEILQADAAGRAAERPYNILDLGSGSGQISWHIARAMPSAQVVGIEISYVPWLRSVVRQKLFGPSNLAYKRVDFWPYDTSAAAAIVTYLPGKIMERVGKKLRAELKPQTLVVSNVFPLRADWEPLETMTVRVPFKTNLFVYRQA